MRRLLARLADPELDVVERATTLLAAAAADAFAPATGDGGDSTAQSADKGGHS
jgi:hypothetical protein